MTRGLANRLARLEKRHRPRRARPAILLKLYEEPDDRIIGVSAGNGETFNRRWGEGLDALCERARPASRVPAMLTAVYAPAPAVMPPVAPSPTLEAPLPKFAGNWSDYREQEGLKP